MISVKFSMLVHMMLYKRTVLDTTASMRLTKCVPAPILLHQIVTANSIEMVIECGGCSLSLK